MARVGYEPGRPRARSVRMARSFAVFGETEGAWIDLGGRELRLRGDTGQVMWSASLPDSHAGLARLEFGERELESLGEEELDEGGIAHGHR